MNDRSLLDASPESSHGAEPAPEPAPPAKRRRPRYEGDPTLFAVMRRPQWIGALLLALAVAAGFAWLGQWQLGHAVRSDHQQAVDSEAVRPIAEVTAAGESVSDGAGGMLLEVHGRLVAGDFTIVEQRSNAGELGVWVVGHLETAEPGETVPGADTGHLAVALGWAPDVATAERALAALEEDHAASQLAMVGRYMPSDGAVKPDPSDSVDRLLSMVPAQLVNLWQPFDGPAYAGYLVMHPGDPLSESVLTGYGLDPIDSVPPLPVERINWLNLFYAVEWVVFAGFAVFFWYRLVRDDWERAHELQLLQAEDAAAHEE